MESHSSFCMIWSYENPFTLVALDHLRSYFRVVGMIISVPYRESYCRPLSQPSNAQIRGCMCGDDRAAPRTSLSRSQLPLEIFFNDMGRSGLI